VPIAIFGSICQNQNEEILNFGNITTGEMVADPYTNAVNPLKSMLESGPVEAVLKWSNGQTKG